MNTNGTLTGTEVSTPITTNGEQTAIHVGGDFGGGSVTMQFQRQDLQWANVADDDGKGVWTADATRVMRDRRPMRVRLSAVNVTSVYWEIR